MKSEVVALLSMLIIEVLALLYTFFSYHKFKKEKHMFYHVYRKDRTLYTVAFTSIGLIISMTILGLIILVFAA